MPEPGLTGLVLAGGASTRMGTDKASLRVGGQTMARRVAGRLRPVCREVLVASGDGARLPDVGDRQVADVRPGAGPLAGIVAGLEAARTPLVAVVAVDMPWASAAVLSLLTRCWRGEPAVVPVDDAGLQPLHAVYARTAAAELRARLAAGQRSLCDLVVAVGAVVVGEDHWRAVDPTARFAVNVNRPEELARLAVGADDSDRQRAVVAPRRK